MKRTLSWLLVLTIAVLCACPAALADEEITVNVNGVPVVWTDARPFIENDRTLCPLRAVAEAMGLDVEWDPVGREALFSRTGTFSNGVEYSFTASFPVDTPFVSVSEFYKYADSEWGDFAIKPMDTSAVIRNDRSYAPVRYLAEAFGYQVEWVHETRTVEIMDDPTCILQWDYFDNWEGYVGVYLYPDKRFEKFGSVEAVSAKINDAVAIIEKLSPAELAALNDEFLSYEDAVYAFKIYGDFEETATYEISWDLELTDADGNVHIVTMKWDYVGGGFGGYGI